MYFDQSQEEALTILRKKMNEQELSDMGQYF